MIECLLFKSNQQWWCHQTVCILNWSFFLKSICILKCDLIFFEVDLFDLYKFVLTNCSLVEGNLVLCHSGVCPLWMLLSALPMEQMINVTVKYRHRRCVHYIVDNSPRKPSFGYCKRKKWIHICLNFICFSFLSFFGWTFKCIEKTRKWIKLNQWKLMNLFLRMKILA